MKTFHLPHLGLVFLWISFFSVAWAASPSRGTPPPFPFTPSPTNTPLVIAQDDPAPEPSTASQVGPALHITQAAPEKRLVLKPGSRLWIKGATTKWSFELSAGVLLGSGILKAPLETSGGEKALLDVVQKEGVQALNLAVPVDQLKTGDVKVTSEDYSLAGPQQALKGRDNPYVQFRLEELTLGKEIKPGTFPLTASGKLTVAGVTRDIPLKAQASFSRNQVRVEGFYRLRLDDFKVNPRSDIWGPMKPTSVEVHFDVVFGPE